MEMQLELVARVCNYVLESCVRVAPRRPLAMAAKLTRSGADGNGGCPHATPQSDGRCGRARAREDSEVSDA